MSPVVDATAAESIPAAVEAAAAAVRAGDLVVLPTDTVYGIGCDAFDPQAVSRLLAAKGRGREMPPPVLVGDLRTLDGLASDVPPFARDLVERFWPGPLTLICYAQPSLHWDLGDTDGTVALRMPDDEVALALLREVGPMAVTSANQSGSAPATTILEAATALGAAVSVYLDGGPRTEQVPSTIVDCTREEPLVLRDGSITAAQIAAVAALDNATTGTDETDEHSDDTPDDTPATPDETPATSDETGATSDETPATSDETGATPDETPATSDDTGATPGETPATPDDTGATTGEETLSRTGSAPDEHTGDPARRHEHGETRDGSDAGR